MGFARARAAARGSSILYPALFFHCAIGSFIDLIGLAKPVSEGEAEDAAIPFYLEIFSGIGEGSKSLHCSCVQDIAEAQLQRAFFLQHALAYTCGKLSGGIDQLLYVLARTGRIKPGNLAGIAFPKRKLIAQIDIQLADSRRVIISAKSHELFVIEDSGEVDGPPA